MSGRRPSAPRWFSHLRSGWDSGGGIDDMLIREVTELAREEVRCSAGEALFLVNEALSMLRRGG